MIRWFIVDGAHLLLWGLHFLILLVSFLLQSLTFSTLVPPEWVKVLGDDWRQALMLLAFMELAVFCGLYTWWVRRHPNHEIGAAVRRRKNLFSFQVHGVALGSKEGLPHYSRQAFTEWTRCLSWSGIGIWKWRWSGISLAFNVLLPIASLLPKDVILLFVRPASVRESTIKIEDASLQFPSYTGRPPQTWDSSESRPIHADFILGSSFTTYLKPDLSSTRPQLSEVRVHTQQQTLTPEWSESRLSYFVQIQLMEDTSLVFQECVWGRYWESSPTLFKFKRTPDQLPTIEVVYMNEEEEIVEGTPLPIRVQATDDFGVRRLALKITQEGRTIEELIKYFSQPIQSYEEIFQWDSTGVPLKEGKFTLEVSARDASPELRSPDETVSDRGTFTFVTIQSHLESLRGLLEAWLTKTREAIQDLSEDKGSPRQLESYANFGDQTLRQIESKFKFSQYPTLAGEWNMLKLRMAPFLENHTFDAIQRERTSQTLEAFEHFLRGLIEKKQEEELEEISTSVWESFDAFKDSQLSSTPLNESQKRMFREKFEKNLKDWMKLAKSIENDGLNQWLKDTKVLEKMKNVQEAHESADKTTLDDIEKELTTGMGLWEKSLVERDQQQLEATRQKMRQAVEALEGILERELQIRKATEEFKAKETFQKWDRVEETQKNLKEDTDESLEASLEELKDNPLMAISLQMMLRQAMEFMGMAEKSLGDKNVEKSIEGEERVLQTLMNASKQVQQMMEQLGQNAQFSRGSGRRQNSYFKRTIHGTYEGPKEYREAIRKNIDREKDSPLKEDERKMFYQRLIK